MSLSIFFFGFTSVFHSNYVSSIFTAPLSCLYTCLPHLVQIPYPCPSLVNVSLWQLLIPLLFSVPYPLISLSVCAPSFHISPLSFFVLFLLFVVHIKHWHQIDSHVNKAAVGGQKPLLCTLKLLPCSLLLGLHPNIHPLFTSHSQHCPLWKRSKHIDFYFAMADANNLILYLICLINKARVPH